MLTISARKVLRNPWFWFFVTTCAFQIFRGSFGDTIIFGLAAIVIAIAASDLLPRDFLDRKQVRLFVSLPVAIGLALALSLLPRHSAIHATIFIAVLPIVLALVWHRDPDEKLKPNTKQRRARTIWAGLCVGTCLWELGANSLVQLNHTLYEFPTISILLDPALDTLIGQGIFVIVWLAVGWGFLRLGVKR